MHVTGSNKTKLRSFSLLPQIETLKRGIFWKVLGWGITTEMRERELKPESGEKVRTLLLLRAENVRSSEAENVSSSEAEL